MLTSLQALLTDTFSLRRAFVVTGPEFPTDIFPILYGDLAGGKGGVSYCPGIIEASYTYLIADHAVVSSGGGNSPTFYADNIVTVPASWNDANTVAGQTAATVTFSSSMAGTRIGYRGKGKMSGGVLIENPVSVVEDFLRTVIGVASTDFDATALAEAKARAALAGYKCAGVLDQDRSPATTISEILACFGGYYFINPDGRIVVVIDDGTVPQMSGIAAHLRAHEFEQAEATWTRTDVVNQVGVNYTRNSYDITLQQRFQDADDGTESADAISQQIHGEAGPGVSETALEFPWCRDGDTVRAVQEVIVSRLATPRARVRVQSPSFRLAHLDVGDYVGFSWPRLYDAQGRTLKNQIGLIEEIAIDGDSPKVDLTIRDTGAYLARCYPADGSVTAGGTVQAGSERDQRDYY